MPLDGNGEWMLGKFHGFNDRIRGEGRADQSRRQVADCLVVVAVDLCFSDTIDLRELSPLLNRNPVGELAWLGCALLVIQRTWVLARDVLNQAAAERYIDYLNPATDAKQRGPSGNCARSKPKLERVAAFIYFIESRAWGLMVAGRINVSTAAQDNAIEPQKQFIGRILVRHGCDENRDPAGEANRLRIGLHCGQAVATAGGRRAGGGDADPGSRHGYGEEKDGAAGWLHRNVGFFQPERRSRSRARFPVRSRR